MADEIRLASRRERHKDQRRTRIVDAAYDLLREVGADDLSVKMIAERADVSAATIYNLFGAKGAVLEKVYARDFEAFVEKVAATGPMSALDAVFESVRIAADLYRSDPAFYRGMSIRDPRAEPELVISVQGPRVESFQDWGLLGYFAGGVAGEDHPVITGSVSRPDLTELKHFGAAAATSGGVELYHIPGITPEAPTVEAAFNGAAAVPRAVVYGPAERRAMYETLNEIGSSDDVDFVLLGCPHASVDQIRRTAELLDGRRLSAGTELWIMAPRSLKVVADRSGYTAMIERAGGRVLADSCPAMSKAAPRGTKVFATDSAKQAHYLPAILGIEAWFGTLDECVDAAVTGRWNGGLRLCVLIAAASSSMGGRSYPAASRARPSCRTSRFPDGAGLTRPAA